MNNVGGNACENSIPKLCVEVVVVVIKHELKILFIKIKPFKMTKRKAIPKRSQMIR